MERAPKFEVVGNDIESNHSAPYDREATAIAAEIEALDILKQEFTDAISHSETVERVAAFKELIGKYGKTLENTNTPANNEYRHLVEQFSLMLTLEEARLRLESTELSLVK